MGDNRERTSRTSLGWLFWAFIWGCVGYLIYGTPIGVITLAFFSAITSITALLGIFPIIGVWFTYMATGYIKTWLLGYVAMSWAISVIFWVTLLFSGLLTIIALIALIAIVT